MQTQPQTRPIPHRVGTALVGVLLLVFGVVGIAMVASGPATADAPNSRSDNAEEAHERMHRMMVAMHGEEALEQVHDVHGGEDMMQECAAMMSAMNAMGDMMHGIGGTMHGNSGTMGSR